MTALETPVSPDDHRAGPDDAPVTLLEYGDYECPGCAAAQPVLHAVRERLGPRLRFVFRHFPLGSEHPHAEHAAEAAEAAAAQGRFWEMHESLFAHPAALQDKDLVHRAQSLHVDVTRFEEELRAGTHTEAVVRSFWSGVRSGVTGTPSFFINGVRHQGPADVESLAAALEAAAGR